MNSITNRLAKSMRLGACSVVALMALGAGVANADPLPYPAMVGTLKMPDAINLGPDGSNILIGGALTGLGYTQNHSIAGDKKSRGDLTNAHIFVEKADGPVQFYVQAGGYSFPTVGVPYFTMEDTVEATFDWIPMAYATFAPVDGFSVSIGKLPTLIGAELIQTYQNSNITRGQLWNQENIFNHGVQVNYAGDAFSLSVSVNDGYLSKQFSWVTALATIPINDNNTLALAAGANLSSGSGKTRSMTPLLQNNSEMYNVIWTYKNGPLTLTPYFQYTHIPAIPRLGIREGSTTGAALLLNYVFNDNFSLGARAEWIDSKKATTTNLLYGVGSGATTLTLTPTFQIDRYFIRGEVAYIGLNDFARGSGFGAAGNTKSQTRLMVETGLLF
jgi:hypothetical protein